MDCKNIDYFLFLKKKYINIFNYVTEIINSYEEMLLHSNDFLLQCNKYKTELSELKHSINSEIKHLINDVNYSICQICEHDFVEDEVDLTPDRSQKIEYCSICEYTKEL
jgi:hypothetical protein